VKQVKQTKKAGKMKHTKNCLCHNDDSLLF